VTYYTMQKSCFHRAVSKRAQESRRKQKRADESRSEPSQQKGGMFIIRCSATVGYTRHAISTVLQYYRSKIRSPVPRDSDPRMTALARANSNYKRQTRPLVRESAPLSDGNKNLVVSPRWVLYSKIDCRLPSVVT
jgi:hypothetical protein